MTRVIHIQIIQLVPVNHSFIHIRIIHSYTYKSFICDTSHTYTNHSLSARDSFIHEWFVYVWMSHRHSMNDSYMYEWVTVTQWMIRICVTQIIHIRIIHWVPVTHSYVTCLFHTRTHHSYVTRIIHVRVIHWVPVTHLCVTSLIHMCDNKTHTFGGKRNLWTHPLRAYGVASIRRLLKIIGLFCKRAPVKETIFCKSDL